MDNSKNIELLKSYIKGDDILLPYYIQNIHENQRLLLETTFNIPGLFEYKSNFNDFKDIDKDALKNYFKFYLKALNYDIEAYHHKVTYASKVPFYNKNRVKNNDINHPYKLKFLQWISNVENKYYLPHRDLNGYLLEKEYPLTQSHLIKLFKNQLKSPKRYSIANSIRNNIILDSEYYTQDKPLSRRIVNTINSLKRTSGVSQLKSNTNVIWIDIDSDLSDKNFIYKNWYKEFNLDRDSEEPINDYYPIIDKITNYSKKYCWNVLLDIIETYNIAPENLLLLEISIFTGGIHLMIKSDTITNNDKFIEHFKQDIKERIGYDKIDLGWSNRILRYPNSFEYILLDRNTHKPLNTFAEAFNYAKNNTPITNSIISDIINDINEIKPEPIKPKSKKCIEFEKYFFNVDNQVTFTRKNSKYKLSKKEHYTPKIQDGNRWDTFKLTIPFYKGQGYTLDQIADKLYSLGTSKDLRKWTKEELIHNITPFYNKIKTKIQANPLQYNSNKHLLNNSLNNWILNSYGLFFHCIEEQWKNTYKTKAIPKQEHKYLYELTKEIFLNYIAQFIYDFNNPKTITVNNSDIYYNSGYWKYNYIGSQFSTSTLNKLHQGFNNEYSKNNPNISKRILNKNLSNLNKFVLNAINFFTDNKYYKGSCKYYQVNTNLELLNKISHEEFLQILLNSLRQRFKDIINELKYKQYVYMNILLDNINKNFINHEHLYMFTEKYQKNILYLDKLLLYDSS